MTTVLDVTGRIVPDEILAAYGYESGIPTGVVIKRIVKFDTDAELRARLAVIDSLAAHGVPVAATVRTLAGTSFFRDATGTAFVASRRLVSTAAGLDQADLNTWRTVGAQLADLHAGLRECGDRVDSFDIDLAGVVTSTMWARLVGAESDGILPSGLTTGIDCAALIDATSGLPIQRLHGDCHGGNLLADSSGLYGVIDLDHLPIGPRIFDLAYYAADLVKNRDDLPTDIVDTIGAVIAGYHARAPLSAAELGALVPTMIVSELRMIHWFLAGHGPAEHRESHNHVLAWVVAHAGDLAAALPQAR